MTKTTKRRALTHADSIEDDAQTPIIDAAIRCFERLTLERISMDDIAKEAGVSRNTVYRAFTDRSELIQLVLMRRLASMFVKAERNLKTYKSVEDAFVEGSLASIAIGQRDKLFIRIVQHDSDYKMEQFLFLEDDPIQRRLLEIWQPIIAQGRYEKILRDDLTDTDIIKLIRSVHFSLHNRVDLSRDGRRFFLRNLLWAAVTNKEI